MHLKEGHLDTNRVEVGGNRCNSCHEYTDYVLRNRILVTRLAAAVVQQEGHPSHAAVDRVLRRYREQLGVRRLRHGRTLHLCVYLVASVLWPIREQRMRSAPYDGGDDPREWGYRPAAERWPLIRTTRRWATDVDAFREHRRRLREAKVFERIFSEPF